MGLLNHLFGSVPGIASELVTDENKRLTLWLRHMADYERREKLSKHFSFGNITAAMADMRATLGILSEIEALISPEIISITEEEKVDEEIRADISRLKGVGHIDATLSAIAAPQLLREQKREDLVLGLFLEVHDVLVAELHLIRLIRKRPANARELLLQLFRLMFHNEAMLYKMFQEKFFHDKSVHSDILRIARSSIIEREIEREMETDETIFARKMLSWMAKEESAHSYRVLGERICDKLVELAQEELPEGAFLDEVMLKMESFLGNDAIIYSVVRGLRPRYSDAGVRATVSAFKAAFNRGHFDNLFEYT